MTTAYDKIFIAADHAGFELKEKLIALTPELPWKNLGTNDATSVDYPDYANKVVDEMVMAEKLSRDQHSIGVLICGSGQGMAIRANRNPHIRAALCFSEEMARLSRAHNNANILCLGSRFTDAASAKAMLSIFLTTKFEGGRHERRVTKLSEPIRP